MAIPKNRHKDLEKFWYDLLKAGGFEDIEDTSSDERTLKAWHSFKFIKWSKNKIHADSDYFYRAKEFLLKWDFDNETERTIWSMHCEGLSNRQIEFEMNRLNIECQRTRKRKGSKTIFYKKDSIRAIINKIKAQMT